MRSHAWPSRRIYDWIGANKSCLSKYGLISSGSDLPGLIIVNAVNALVAYQFRLHPAVLEKAVGMQTEAMRMRFAVKQLIDGTYKPEVGPKHKPRKPR